MRWPMLQLERTAEQRLREASLISVRGEVAARKEVQRCTIILDNIRRLRIAASRLRSFTRVLSGSKSGAIACRFVPSEDFAKGK